MDQEGIIKRRRERNSKTGGVVIRRTLSCTKVFSWKPYSDLPKE